MKALLLFIGLFFATPVFAQTVEDGVKAFNEGNYEKAKSVFIPLAETGHPKSINMLGLMYDDGLGVEANKKIACDHFEKSAELGYVSAQRNISLCYEFGEGRNIDYKKMIFWREKSAMQGSLNAKIDLMRFYYSTNHELSKKWGQQAIDAGSTFALVAMWEADFDYVGPEPTYMQIACVLVMNVILQQSIHFCE